MLAVSGMSGDLLLQLMLSLALYPCSYSLV